MTITNKKEDRVADRRERDPKGPEDRAAGYEPGDLTRSGGNNRVRTGTQADRAQ